MASRFRAERVPLDRGGYDRRGQYWGTGTPLYRVTSDEDGIDEHVRAQSAVEARQKIQTKHGLARGVTTGDRGRLQRIQLRIRALLDNEPRMSVPDAGRAANRLLRDVVRLAADVRSQNPDDRAWRYYDRDIEEAERSLRGELLRMDFDHLERGLFRLRQATQMIEGALSRAPRAAAVSGDRRRSSRSRGSRDAWR